MLAQSSGCCAGPAIAPRQSARTGLRLDRVRCFPRPGENVIREYEAAESAGAELAQWLRDGNEYLVLARSFSTCCIRLADRCRRRRRRRRRQQQRDATHGRSLMSRQEGLHSRNVDATSPVNLHLSGRDSRAPFRGCDCSFHCVPAAGPLAQTDRRGQRRRRASQCTGERAA